MPEQKVQIHLSTNELTEEIDISFIPDENSIIPFDEVSKWKNFREKILKPKVRNELKKNYKNREDYTLEEAYKSVLSSDRLGQRLDVCIGYVIINEESEEYTMNIELVETFRKLKKSLD